MSFRAASAAGGCFGFLLALFFEIWLTRRFECLDDSSVILCGSINAAVWRGVFYLFNYSSNAAVFLGVFYLFIPFSIFLNIWIDEILVASPDLEGLDELVLRDCFEILDTLDTNVSSNNFAP